MLSRKIKDLIEQLNYSRKRIHGDHNIDLKPIENAAWGVLLRSSAPIEETVDRILSNILLNIGIERCQTNDLVISFIMKIENVIRRIQFSNRNSAILLDILGVMLFYSESQIIYYFNNSKQSTYAMIIPRELNYLPETQSIFRRSYNENNYNIENGSIEIKALSGNLGNINRTQLIELERKIINIGRKKHSRRLNLLLGIGHDVLKGGQMIDDLCNELAKLLNNIKNVDKIREIRKAIVGKSSDDLPIYIYLMLPGLREYLKEENKIDDLHNELKLEQDIASMDNVPAVPSLQSVPVLLTTPVHGIVNTDAYGDIDKENENTESNNKIVDSEDITYSPYKSVHKDNIQSMITWKASEILLYLHKYMRSARPYIELTPRDQNRLRVCSLVIHALISNITAEKDDYRHYKKQMSLYTNISILHKDMSLVLDGRIPLDILKNISSIAGYLKTFA